MNSAPGQSHWAGESSIIGNLGRGERIRTSGLCVPNAALYQAKLHPENTGIVPVDDWSDPHLFTISTQEIRSFKPTPDPRQHKGYDFR